MPIYDHFSFLAPFYETFIPPKEPHEIWRLAKFPVSGALLDAGGGTGRIAQFMIGKADPIVVMDLSWKMLGNVKSKTGLQPVCSKTELLPFSDGTFARIIMVDALHHVFNRQHTIDELWRVLQPGGRIVIEEPDINTFAVKLIAIGEKLALMRSHFLTPKGIVKLFKYSKARVQLEIGKSSAWVVADKEQTIQKCCDIQNRPEILKTS
jgi:demethylmenaquinone methyltransferase/2-methoxy-6-polyprenyl-1,4-benzoquinol methylase